MATVTLTKTPKQINKLVAHMAEVDRAVKAAAERVHALASGVLAEHHHSGDAQITLTHGRVDYFVNLDDTRGQRAAAAIEFGHIARNGRFVPGIHALTRSFK